MRAACNNAEGKCRLALARLYLIGHDLGTCFHFQNARQALANSSGSTYVTRPASDTAGHAVDISVSQDERSLLFSSLTDRISVKRTNAVIQFCSSQHLLTETVSHKNISDIYRRTTEEPHGGVQSQSLKYLVVKYRQQSPQSRYLHLDQFHLFEI